ncbi:MAG: hypothetical protein AMXMBFR84_17840 [Candidatus Hydrogenedentota bacterium]
MIEGMTATPGMATELARMNQKLIADEGHRNPMTFEELRQRMLAWLSSEYEATVLRCDAKTVGYALFRRETEFIYLRQFWIAPEYRRRGIGRAAIAWLETNVWHGHRIRLDVLVNNAPGIAFWRAVGFEDYCLTMEKNA